MVGKKYSVCLIDENLLGFQIVRRVRRLIVLSVGLPEIFDVFVRVLEIVLNSAERSI